MSDEETSETSVKLNIESAKYQTSRKMPNSFNIIYPNYGKEFCFYLIFLVTVCTISYSVINTTTYYLNSALEKIFIRSPIDSDDEKDFTQINTINDFWKFSEQVLINNLYWETWYNGEPLKKNEGIYYTTLLLGSPRLRQLRVRNDSCKIHEEFKSKIKECFAAYSLSSEETEPFGLKNGTAWTFHRDPAMLYRKYHGQLSTYYSGGYYIDLGITKKEAKQAMILLKENRWIDKSTRVIFLDFALYNANVNLFCLIKLIWELPTTGGLLTTWKIHSMKFLRYLSPWDHVVLAIEYLFCFFTLINFIIILKQILKKKRYYFTEIWNYFEIIIFIISLLGIIFSVYRNITIRKSLSILLANPDKYPDIEDLAHWETHFNKSVAIIVFFCWIKFFKFISFNKTMKQLSYTISRCWKDVCSFGFMFFIVFFAYSQLGYLLFGYSLKDYCNIGNSFFTLLRIILGEYDFYQLQDTDNVLGPLYFVTYVFFVFFVLLNMFLAIINDTYANVKEEMKCEDSDAGIISYLKSIIFSTCESISNKFRQTDSKKSESQLDLQQIYVALKARGFKENEILYIFKKYEITKLKYLELEDLEELIKDVYQNRNVILENS